MRKFIVLVAACFLVCGLFLTVQPASAATSTAWEPSGAQFFTVDFAGGDYVYGIYEYSNPEHCFVLTEAGDYTKKLEIKNGVLWVEGSATNFVFQNSTNFGFYFNGDYDYALDGTQNAWDLYFNNVVSGSPNISVSGANPVPIPTAMLLLGSGLVGLVGFRRKIKA